MKAVPNCDMKTRLLTEYQAATEVYSKTVSELSRMIGKTTRIEYEKLHQSVESARLVAGKARQNLDAHANQHGC